MIFLIEKILFWLTLINSLNLWIVSEAISSLITYIYATYYAYPATRQISLSNTLCISLRISLCICHTWHRGGPKKKSKIAEKEQIYGILFF
jgi:hypothetical protein